MGGVISSLLRQSTPDQKQACNQQTQHNDRQQPNGKNDNISKSSWHGATNPSVNVHGRKSEEATNVHESRADFYTTKANAAIWKFNRTFYESEEPLNTLGFDGSPPGLRRPDLQRKGPTRVQQNRGENDHMNNEEQDSPSLCSENDSLFSSDSEDYIVGTGPWKEKQRRNAINRIVNSVENRLPGWLSMIVHGSELGKNRSSDSTSSWHENLASGSGTSYSHVLGKRPAVGRYNPGGNDQESEDESTPKRPRKQQKASNEGKFLFACPYFKRNPSKYGRWPQCPGPGWPTVARVKEHLYRKHALPEFKCNRCCVDFQTSKWLKDHQRLEETCEKVDEIPQDGFDKDQEKQLRIKKRVDGIDKENQYWSHVYKILFPKDEHIPSPYYEYHSEDLIEKLRHIQGECLPLLRQRLESEMGDILNPHVREQIAFIWQRTLQEQLEKYEVIPSKSGILSSGYELDPNNGHQESVDNLNEDSHLYGVMDEFSDYLLGINLSPGHIEDPAER